VQPRPTSPLAGVPQVPRRAGRLVGGGIGWIPTSRAHDHSYKAHKAWTFADFGDKLPSQVFSEHVILCFIEDDFGARNAREIGNRPHLHRDGLPAQRRDSGPTRPSASMQAWELTDLTDHEINQMTHENAMRFYQFDPYAIRPREKLHGRRAAVEAVGHDVFDRRQGRRVEHHEPMTLAGFRAHRVMTFAPTA